MDYFLFDFSGVQFHYTMSLSKLLKVIMLALYLELIGKMRVLAMANIIIPSKMMLHYQ